MELAYIILGIVGLLGVFSIWKNSRKSALINHVIKEYLLNINGTLIKTETPSDSGPFGDEYYDKKHQNLYENIGYQSKETIYRKITYKVTDTEQIIWLQLRVDNLEAVYTAWENA